MDFLLDNIFYVVAAAVSGAMLIWPLLRPKAGCPLVSTLDATMRINRQDAAVLDVRTAEQYAQGHLPRARNIPAKELPERLNEIERLKNKPLIVAAETDAAATGAARLLKSKGFTEVLILEGGIEAWRKAELPLEK